MNKKFLARIGILALLVVGAFVFFNVIGFIINPIVPTDTKIVDALFENEDYLLGIDGVIGAGIARNESNNYIIGIAVYVEDNMTNVQEIPSELGEFKVFIKRISEASEFEKKRMIIRSTRYRLLNVTTDKTVYHQNDNIVVTINSKSNETVVFGNSVYDLFFEKWNDVSWEFYTGVIGLEVITYLYPEEIAEIDYQLGGQTDKPFPSGRYRVVSCGWLDHNGEIVYVWGYAEFTVE